MFSVQAGWAGKKKGDAATVRVPVTLLARAPHVACVARQIDAEYDQLLQGLAKPARPPPTAENSTIWQADVCSFDTPPVDNVFFECDDAFAVLRALRWRMGRRWVR